MRLLLFLISFKYIVCIGQQKNTIRYISLGDSYTIGTGAKESEAWPVILTKHLNDKQIATELVDNPARNGYSTQNLIDFELPVFDKSNADFVTLLIGVNDWVRGVETEIFHKNFIFILEHVQKKLTVKKNIILITIPDFGVTSTGSKYGGGRDISKGITEFNDIIKSEAKKRGLLCVDIFPVSKKMKSDLSLVAADGLHPSFKEYAEWERLIFPEAVKLLTLK